MKKLMITTVALIGLSACAIKPQQKPQQVFVPPTTPQNVPITSVSNIPAVAFVYEADVSAMTRNQVIQATRECQDAGLRASPVTAKRRITGTTSEVVVEILCLPRFQ